MADVLEAPTLAPTDAGEHDRFKHFVPKRQLTDSSVYGQPLTALCGKKWIPNADPERFPMCQTCLEIWEAKE